MKFSGNISPIQKRINGSEKIFSELSVFKDSNFIDKDKIETLNKNHQNLEKLNKKIIQEKKIRGRFLKNKPKKNSQKQTGKFKN